MPERGAPRTYLGTAPGIGKTHAMLADARARAAAGEKLVVGWLEQHDRPGLESWLVERSNRH
jgi:two-component system sensor histidine kinase KdpD